MSRERNKPYAEDSTKGLSLINPLNYKGDVLVQVWVDSRVLATLCRWLDKNEVYSRFMSQVVRRPLEVVADMLVSNGEVEMVDDTAEARALLERRFGVDLSRGGRGTKNTMHNIVLSDRRSELGERIGRGSKFNDANKPKSGRSTLVQDTIDKYKSLYGEDGKVIVKEKMSEMELDAKAKELEVSDKKVDSELDAFLNSLDGK
jgi:hypothetical protein